MYQIINETIEAYLITNEDVLEPATKKQIEIARTYTAYWSRCEYRREQLQNTFSDLGIPELVSYCEITEQLDIKLHDDPKLDAIIDDLWYIDEALAYEEENCLGLSRTARYHRKRWRKLIRAVKKYFKVVIKNHLAYQKEWSKPKTHYISKYTGETHNGLYWTIRACIDQPAMIFRGFYKEG